MKRTIYIAPYGGLCNRLRVVASAYQYSADKKRDTQLYWIWERACNIKFHQLFYPIQSNNNFVLKDSNRLDRQWDRRLNFHIPTILRKIEGVYDLGILPYHMLGRGDASFIPEDSEVYVASSHYYYRCKTPLKEIFKPLPEIMDRVDEVKLRFSENTVGIHIRRTDNVDAIKTSPDEFFQIMMDKMLETSDAHFFLASDDLNVKDKFVKRYGKRIITYNSKLSRSSNSGMKDAFIELLCLAGTNKIIGSFNSSFNEFAAAYGNIELILPGRTVTHDYLGFWED